MYFRVPWYGRDQRCSKSVDVYYYNRDGYVTMNRRPGANQHLIYHHQHTTAPHLRLTTSSYPPNDAFRIVLCLRPWPRTRPWPLTVFLLRRTGNAATPPRELSALRMRLPHRHLLRLCLISEVLLKLNGSTSLYIAPAACYRIASVLHDGAWGTVHSGRIAGCGAVCEQGELCVLRTGQFDLARSRERASCE